MRRPVLALAMAAAFVVTASASDGMQRGQGGGPKPNAGSQGPKVQSHGTQGPKVQSHAAQGPKVKSTAPAMQPRGSSGGARKTSGPSMKPATGATAKNAATTKTHPTKTTTTASGTKTKGSSADAGSKSAKATTSKSKKTTTATTTASTTTGGTGSTATLTPVQQKLQKNTQLASKLESRLPAGTDLMTAAEGFRNFGQFVAAVNVSNNLGIPFEQLKMRMVEDKMSLGQAIKVERPLANTDYELRRAEGDADKLIRTTSTTDPTLGTSPTTPTKTKSTSRTRTGGAR
jgi:hypothetical protein